MSYHGIPLFVHSMVCQKDNKRAIQWHKYGRLRHHTSRHTTSYIPSHMQCLHACHAITHAMLSHMLSYVSCRHTYTCHYHMEVFDDKAEDLDAKLKRKFEPVGRY
jgi:hypothetical protein